MSSGGSGGTSWFWTLWSSLPTMSLLGGWNTFIAMIISWAGGVISMVFWWTVGLQIACWLESALCWLLAEVLGQVLPRLTPILQGMPTAGVLGGSWWVQSWLFVDYLFPLHETVIMLAFLFTFVFMFRLLRFGKQFIPGASN